MENEERDATLMEKCRARKDELGLTIRDVEAGTQLSHSTVTKFFAGERKSPSVVTAGKICAFLGVSLDQHFGMQQTQDDPMDKERIQAHLDHIRELNARLENSHQVCNTLRAIVLLLAILAVGMAVYALARSHIY